MGLATVLSRAAVGIEAPQVLCEVNLSPGLPMFAIVGLPETTVRESQDRTFRRPLQRRWKAGAVCAAKRKVRQTEAVASASLPAPDRGHGQCCLPWITRRIISSSSSSL